MGKITFRADDDLVDELEAFDASKSEVMREALRTYLDAQASPAGSSRHDATGADEPPRGRSGEDSIDQLIRDRVDALLEERLSNRSGAQDVNVTVALEGAGDGTRPADPDRTVRKTDRQSRKTNRPSRAPADGSAEESADLRQCGQCGERVDADHVFCPNCGEKASRRLFCECGDELRSDWSFCPGCGRRTPAADVLDSA